MTILELIQENSSQLINGLLTTLKLTGLSLLFACLIGLLIGLMNVSRSKALRTIAKIYIDLIRGIPLMVLLFFIYFGITGFMKTYFPSINLSVDSVSILVLSLNAGAYMAEIFRAGIQAVPVGQMEAARSLGMPYGKTMWKIILPQAVRMMIPSIINQFIISLKDTTILSAIGVRDLFQNTRIIVSSNFESFKMYAICAVMYLVIITLLSLISKQIEKRISLGKS